MDHSSVLAMSNKKFIVSYAMTQIVLRYNISSDKVGNKGDGGEPSINDSSRSAPQY